MYARAYVSIYVSMSVCGWVGRDGALVESITFNRRVVGSTPALAATYTDLGQVLYLQAAVACALRRENPIQ